MGRRERRRDREKLEWRVERREIRSFFLEWRVRHGDREKERIFFLKRETKKLIK